MQHFLSVILLPALLFLSLPAFSQEKYFEVVYEKNEFSNTYYGRAVVRNSKANRVRLEYKGKNRQQLQQQVLAYLKERPALKTDTVARTEWPFLSYHDFATLGTKEQCFADLVALTYIYVVPGDGYISVDLGMSTKIYASIFEAQLKIDPGGNVVSDNDVPFNEYQYVQPRDGRTSSKVSPNGGLLGLATSRKINYKLAYPDSVFDPDGKVVNPANKKLIEDFYDRYISDLKDYLDKHIK